MKFEGKEPMEALQKLSGWRRPAHKEGKWVLIFGSQDRTQQRWAWGLGNLYLWAERGAKWHQVSFQELWQELSAWASSYRVNKDQLLSLEIENQILNPVQASVKPDNLQMRRNLTG